ncbi:PAAR domain-containing protein [Citrobacter arsenatis]|uniref:PAAR domain-containing protein n=1 Tax=Citrobacter arsenatis TaxID=2546350 RepID=UPI00300E1BB3
MKGVIRLGDKTTSGGMVLSASLNRNAYGKGIARVGDKAYCPLEGHGPNIIAEGEQTVKVDGKPVAFHGHRLACGCSLITSLPNVGKK